MLLALWACARDTVATIVNVKPSTAQLSRRISAKEYIGVAFHEGPVAPEAGEELSVALTLRNFPNAMYGKLSPGVSFTVREGRRIVGYGTVRRWLD